MSGARFIASKSGVKVSIDFRDNLIIDRYDPLFMRMRASKSLTGKGLRDLNGL